MYTVYSKGEEWPFVLTCVLLFLERWLLVSAMQGLHQAGLMPCTVLVDTPVAGRKAVLLH
jgi:hypothetical protein